MNKGVVTVVTLVTFTHAQAGRACKSVEHGKHLPQSSLNTHPPDYWYYRILVAERGKHLLKALSAQIGVSSLVERPLKLSGLATDCNTRSFQRQWENKKYAEGARFACSTFLGKQPFVTKASCKIDNCLSCKIYFCGNIEFLTFQSFKGAPGGSC